MARLWNRVLRLTLLSMVAVGMTGCATVGSARRPPSAGDSLLALTRLNETIVDHTRRVLQFDVDRRLALGLRLDRLPNLFAGERREAARYARDVQGELEEINYTALTQDDYLTLLAVHWDLENEAEAPVYRSLDHSAVIPGASPIPAIARALSQHPIENTQDVARYLYLLDNLELFFPEVRQTLVEQAKTGITIPRAALDSVVAFLRQYRQPAGQSPFALSAQGLTRIDSSGRGAVIAALTQKIESAINPQIDSLANYLTTAKQMVPTDSAPSDLLGVGQYPGGGEYYRYLLRRHTTLDVAPTDLFRYGVREVQRISDQLAALRQKLGFKGSDSSFRATLRGDARFVMQSPNDFEVRVRRALAVMRDSVRARLSIEVPDSVELVARPSEMLDGARRVNLREGDALDPRFRLEYAADQITRLPAYVIPALVARELIPGRFALMSAIRRNDSMPTIRQLMRLAGFVDGWSEHARGLAGELGLYADSHEAYGALMLELEAAARMVADLGLHSFGWTHQQAVRYLRVHSVDASTAESDVLRIAVTEPARAVAAKVGSRELAGQRAWVRRELAAQFNDGALQREIFRVGVLPLPLLSQHLTWFVWKAKTAGASGELRGERE